MKIKPIQITPPVNPLDRKQPILVNNLGKKAQKVYNEISFKEDGKGKHVDVKA